MAGGAAGRRRVGGGRGRGGGAGAAAGLHGVLQRDLGPVRGAGCGRRRAGDGGGGWGERPGLKKGQGTAIVTGVISIALAVLYLGLVQVMESRGNYLEPPPPEAFL